MIVVFCIFVNRVVKVAQIDLIYCDIVWQGYDLVDVESGIVAGGLG